MSRNISLYQILFENDTLFRVAGEGLASAPEPEITPIAPPVPAPATAPSTPALTTPAVSPVAAEPVANVSVPLPALRYPVLILTDEPEHEHLKANEATLLDNILKAVGHSVAEADVLNISFLKSNDARSIFSGKRVNYFITFGVPLARLHLDMLLVPYTPKEIQGVMFLLAEPLAIIEADKALKKRLWLALQKMFEKS